MRKLIYFMLAVSAVFACNPDNPDNPGGKDDPADAKATVVRVGTQTLSFDAIGAESQTLKVYADGSWTSEAPDWVTLDPTSGSGTVTVTVSVTDNEAVDGRTGTVVFAPELSSTTNVLTIQQKGDNKVNIKTGQAFAEWLAKLTKESLDEARLAADIDMTGITLVPAEDFSGVLDGEGHSIKNLKSTKPLFKKNSGTLKNIVIDASCSFEPDTLIFGALVARNEGKVDDCTNKGTVTRTIEPTSKESNVIAGLVGVWVDTETTISGCKNYGNVSIVVTDNGKFTTQGVAGVVGYCRGNVSNCENYGNITLSGGYHVGRACPVRDPSAPDNIETGEFYNQKVSSSVGGVAAYIIGTADNCKNEGTVSWIETKAESLSTSPARMFCGGVAGTYYGKVSDCTNAGPVNVKVLTSDRQPFDGQNHQLCVGGVFGALNNPTKDSPSGNRGVEVRNCSNSGKLTFEVYTSKNWMWWGGVIGWPNGADRICNGTMYNCSNTGDFEINGACNFRAGGVAGVSPNMEGCTSKNKIIINGASGSASCGGLIGAHWGDKQVIKDCSVVVEINSAVRINLSAFIGTTDAGDADENSFTQVEGGSVNGIISQNGDGPMGLVIGFCDSKDRPVTVGTSTAPVEVSGKVNGTAITQENALALIWGNNYDPAVHSLNYVVK
ncbi:MAG: BACON domain-containing protein [Bacteroidales bacterium]|nr:BACON domain-containing protein [Bacteroidales bacterium]